MKLKRDLLRVKPGSIIELSTSSDPYPPVEEKLLLTRRSLELLVEHDVKILITTKSDLVTRDIDLLRDHSSAVMITITTLDDKLAGLIEPGALPPSRRINVVSVLSKMGIPVGVRIDPIIPYVDDDEYEVIELAQRVVDSGALHIVTSTHKAKWDNLRRLCERMPDISSKLSSLYREKGIRIRSYIYLPENHRRRLIKPVIETTMRLDIIYATCREILGPYYHRAPSCSGSHLVVSGNPR